MGGVEAVYFASSPNGRYSFQVRLAIADAIPVVGDVVIAEDQLACCREVVNRTVFTERESRWWAYFETRVACMCWLGGESGDVVKDSGDEVLEVLSAEGRHGERSGLVGGDVGEWWEEVGDERREGGEEDRLFEWFELVV